MTKKQKGMLWTHEHATKLFLEGDCGIYKNPSSAKHCASQFCENEYTEYHGFNKRYHSANSFFFSFSYKYVKNRKIHLRYHTANNVYDFVVAEMNDKGQFIPVM